ncbi:tRNA wybutosine-synthesizing protein 2 homolog [Watersipora subatra]|uniref:tRNA wybutosine-synthesizing protein 2 homolog n=1 Tax=Watersipora subatra TaxID=2589382 RepID=UPI00355BEEF3
MCSKQTLAINEWFKDINQYRETDDKSLLISQLPKKWQRHGDIILFPNTAFCHEWWSEVTSAQWTDLARRLKVRRLGLMGKTLCNDFRQPTVRLLLGTDGWTEHVDNHVRYSFDVTKTMFSSGNITEKMRVAKFDCSEEVVADLYAGIGYYTLPYLVHAGASHVHACEWNPDAVEALKAGLRKNNVVGRCTVHSGDNSLAPIEGVADRVNLGLLPSSKPGWKVACAALKPCGGYLHIHDCLNTKAMSKQEAERCYSEETVTSITDLLRSVKPHDDWNVKAMHLEKVKSYAPHITHVVLDVRCAPIT